MLRIPFPNYRIDAGPQVDSIAGPSELCANAKNAVFYLVGASNIQTVDWIVPGDAAIVSSSLDSVVVNFGESGGVVSAILANECSSTGVGKTVSLVNSIVPFVSILVQQDTVCSGETIVLTANFGGTGSSPLFEWSVNGEVIQSNSGVSTFELSPENGDVVSVLMTSDAACSSIDTVSASEPLFQYENISGNALVLSGESEVCVGETNLQF